MRWSPSSATSCTRLRRRCNAGTSSCWPVISPPQRRSSPKASETWSDRERRASGRRCSACAPTPCRGSGGPTTRSRQPSERKGSPSPMISRRWPGGGRRGHVRLPISVLTPTRSASRVQPSTSSSRPNRSIHRLAPGRASGTCWRAQAAPTRHSRHTVRPSLDSRGKGTFPRRNACAARSRRCAATARRLRASRPGRGVRPGRAGRELNPLRLQDDRALEPVEERDLGREDLPSRGWKIEPPNAIDLGELANATGPGWPLHLEGVAPRRRRIQIPAERPGDHGLPTSLPDLSELEHRVVRLLLPGLFGELATSDGNEFLPGIGLPLQDRPRSLVLLREERAAGVTEEDLEPPLAMAEQEDAGTEAR